MENNQGHPLRFELEPSQTQKLIDSWVDKTFGYIDGDPSVAVVNLYANEDPIAFVSENIVYIAPNHPELAERHRSAILDCILFQLAA